MGAVHVYVISWVILFLCNCGNVLLYCFCFLGGAMILYGLLGDCFFSNNNNNIISNNVLLTAFCFLGSVSVYMISSVIFFFWFMITFCCIFLWGGDECSWFPRWFFSLVFVMIFCCGVGVLCDGNIALDLDLMYVSDRGHHSQDACWCIAILSQEVFFISLRSAPFPPALYIYLYGILVSSYTK